MTLPSAIEPVSIPDRFEVLRRTAKDDLTSIVVSVDEALAKVDAVFADMSASHRGAFLVMRGNSGVGKTTFLHTVGLFRQNVRSQSMPPECRPREFFRSIKSSGGLEIIVLEEREVEIEFSDAELEALLHGINGFIRSMEGCRFIVVWPCNTDQLRDRVVDLASKLGADSLLGVGEGVFSFDGPAKSQYRAIAERTIAVLNEGATFSDLGLDNTFIDNAINYSPTIGSFLGTIRRQITTNERHVASLLRREHPHLWVIVISGDEPEKEVAALTRGQHAAIDIERLLSATEANVVKELKRYPEKLGVLGSVLDAKIFYLPVLAALAISRAFAEELLKARMKAQDLSLSPSEQEEAIRRVKDTDLARVLSAGSLGRLARGAKIGNNTELAFLKLATIARNNDILLNRAFGRALQAAGLIRSFKTEQDFREGMVRRTDLLCSAEIGNIRIEMMWRSKTSRAEMSNYALAKLQNYGRAIGFLD